MSILPYAVVEASGSRTSRMYIDSIVLDLPEARALTWDRVHRMTIQRRHGQVLILARKCLPHMHSLASFELGGSVGSFLPIVVHLVLPVSFHPKDFINTFFNQFRIPPSASPPLLRLDRSWEEVFQSFALFAFVSWLS